MTDIVERLRAWAEGDDSSFDVRALCFTAAAEILRLRVEVAALREALAKKDAELGKTKTQYRCYACKQVFDEDHGHGLAREHFGDVFRNPLPKCCEVIDGTAKWGGGPHDPFVRVRKDHYHELVASAAIREARKDRT